MADSSILRSVRQNYVTNSEIRENARREKTINILEFELEARPITTHPIYAVSERQRRSDADARESCIHVPRQRA